MPVSPYSKGHSARDYHHTIGKLEPSTFWLYPMYRGMDKPLAQKSRLKKTMSIGDFVHISGQLMS
jgi:hypothetical protein